MALKCRGMGKAMKRRYAEGGEVRGPNVAQRAVGPTLFQDVERKRRAAIEAAELGQIKPEVEDKFKSPPIKPRVVDAKAKAKQDAQFKELMKKQDAPLD